MDRFSRPAVNVASMLGIDPISQSARVASQFQKPHAVSVPSGVGGGMAPRDYVRPSILKAGRNTPRGCLMDTAIHQVPDHGPPVGAGSGGVARRKRVSIAEEAWPDAGLGESLAERANRVNENVGKRPNYKRYRMDREADEAKHECDTLALAARSGNPRPRAMHPSNYRDEDTFVDSPPLFSDDRDTDGRDMDEDLEIEAKRWEEEQKHKMDAEDVFGTFMDTIKNKSYKGITRSLGDPDCEPRGNQGEGSSREPLGDPVYEGLSFRHDPWMYNRAGWDKCMMDPRGPSMMCDVIGAVGALRTHGEMIPRSEIESVMAKHSVHCGYRWETRNVKRIVALYPIVGYELYMVHVFQHSTTEGPGTWVGHLLLPLELLPRDYVLAQLKAEQKRAKAQKRSTY